MQVTIADVNAAFAKGTLTSERLVQMFLARIQAFDRQGPMLRSVITVNPKALETARALDAERKSKGPRSPLHGIPIVVKDNIDTADLPTTGGSVLLEGSIPPDDAFVIRKLRAAGAVIIAKANLSEFASAATKSSIGGQILNPHDLTRSPAGSSGGTGVALAADVCDGRTRHRYRRIGPRSVDQQRHRGAQDDDGTGQPRWRDPAGAQSRHGWTDGAPCLRRGGAVERAHRSGCRRRFDQARRRPCHGGLHAGVAHRCAQGCAAGHRARLHGPGPGCRLGHGSGARYDAKQGATVVDVRLPRWLLDGKGEYYTAVRYPEFVAQIADYLATIGPSYPKNLDQLIERARRVNAPRPDGAGPNPARWSLMFRESGSGTLTDYQYTSVRDHALPLVRDVLSGVLTANKLDAIVYPTDPRRPQSNAAPAAVPGGAGNSPSNLANLSGFPDLIVPAGFSTDDLPIGISFLGAAFSESRLLALGYSFEQATKVRRLPVHTPLRAGESIAVP